ncbi:aldo/keto reductase [Humidisolicoccus flavus]|uniref:aldo/keto reductase n=1 Tax=Humidisolicoccus flavus TaxID=3111414 RepID=UPI00324A9D6F
MSDVSLRSLGSSDLLVSTVGLGCNNFGRRGTITEDQRGTDAVIFAAIDAGITLFDTADMYGGAPAESETMMGKSLRGTRDQIVLATKFGHADFPMPGTEEYGAKGGAQYIRFALEASLRRLQTDWIDLYQLHTPDPQTPIAETLEALAEHVQAGKIRYIGHSNFSAEQIAEAADAARDLGLPAFVSAQSEYSLLRREVEREVLPAVSQYGLGFLPYFPLFNGLLTGKYTREGRPADARLTKLKPQILEDVNWSVLEEYQRIADRFGVSMLEATFAWLLAQPTVSSVIAGATSAEQIRTNAAAGTVVLPLEAVEEITALFKA